MSTRSNNAKPAAPKININLNNFPNSGSGGNGINMDHLRAKPKLSGGRTQTSLGKATLSIIDLDPNEGQVSTPVLNITNSLIPKFNEPNTPSNQVPNNLLPMGVRKVSTGVPSDPNKMRHINNNLLEQYQQADGLSQRSYQMDEISQQDRRVTRQMSNRFVSLVKTVSDNFNNNQLGKRKASQISDNSVLFNQNYGQKRQKTERGGDQSQQGFSQQSYNVISNQMMNQPLQGGNPNQIQVAQIINQNLIRLIQFAEQDLRLGSEMEILDYIISLLLEVKQQRMMEQQQQTDEGGKRRRQRKNNNQKGALEEEYQKCAEWSFDKKRELAIKFGMSVNQVSKWNWDRRKKDGLDTKRKQKAEGKK